MLSETTETDILKSQQQRLYKGKLLLLSQAWIINFGNQKGAYIHTTTEFAKIHIPYISKILIYTFLCICIHIGESACKQSLRTPP